MILFAFLYSARMQFNYKTSDFLNVANHTAIGTDLFTWLHVLNQNKYAVDLRFIPKALFITATAMFNASFQLTEKLFYDGKINKQQVLKPVFILGHPRSGTTYLQYVLGQDPAFAYCSTFEGLVPHIFLTGGKPLQWAMQQLMPSTRPQDNVRVSATLPVEEEFAMANMSHASWVHGLYFPKSLERVFNDSVIFSGTDPKLLAHWKKHFLYFLKKLTYKYPGKQLLLKSPANTGRLRELHELFPDAKFIHIHRNPYEVYQSTERLYEKILPVVSFHRADPKAVKEHIFYFYEKMYQKYLRDKEAIPANQLIEFSYADFTANPMAMMQRTYEQLSLGDFSAAKSFLEKEVTETKGYQKNTYDLLDAATRDRIATQWRFAFDAFGYSV